MSRKYWVAPLALAMAGCASIPDGPSMLVLPGTGRSFDQFRGDDVQCRQYAMFQIGDVSPNDAAANSGLATAAVGTVVGAAAGAALSGGGGMATAAGAGAGLVGGSLIGSSAASSSRYSTQDRYDIAYVQCMYAKGHQVPVSGSFSPPTVAPQPQVLQPRVVQPGGNIPPPPPGSPPPPPPASSVPAGQ